MDIRAILATYDAMFGKCSLSGIEQYLYDYIVKAREESEHDVLFTLLNEMVGFCRDTTQKEKALQYCDELFALMRSMKLEGSVEYATAILNIANAYRAFGLLKESLELFVEAEQIFQQKKEPHDFVYAGLYNNWGLTYQEMRDYERAIEVLLKALEIVDSHEYAFFPQATTRTNLAASLVQLGTEDAYDEAVGYLQQALEIYEKHGTEDVHYSATLVAMGDAYCFKKEFGKAADSYAAGLKEIEKHTGKNDNYTRVLDKYHYAKKQCGLSSKWQSNLERSRQFYETAGKAMIHSCFPEYEDRIAVGLVGEGSDCYGFDDEISMDHDYAVGFCMWLADEDYACIGEALQQEYDKLVTHERRLRYRRGVFSICEFYTGILGDVTRYEEAEEFRLAEATNGMVFCDKLGQFSKIREQILAYYPEKIWRSKLAQKLHEYSQYAQSNYARMMARGDVLTASMCISKAIESTMDIVYLLNKTYAPYYKWKKKGLDRFAMSERFLPLIEQLAELPTQKAVWENIAYDATQIYTEDKCVELFEKIAEEILKELKEQGLVSGDDRFLECYIRQVLEGKNIEMVDKIVALEWKQFDRVNNEGGRASCQDDFETFQIMRKSQYLTWTEELLKNYYQDLTVAEQKGWNLIMEKYARMMEHTNPDKFLLLEKDLPELEEEREMIQELVVDIQVQWMEEFAKQYPRMAENARVVRSHEDTEYETSYETYLRGELGTYSEETFVLYTEFIICLSKEGRNLTKEIMENTAKLYGYDSLESAERGATK